MGLFSGFVAWRALSSRDTPTRKLPIDTVGVILLATWVGALQVVLDLGKNDDWFNSTTIVVLTVVAAIAFATWLIWELTDAHPAVDLSLLRNRNFSLGTAAFCLGYALFFATNLILPVWLQQQLAYTATWAGLVSAPSGAVAVVLTPFLVRFGAKIDARWLATLSFVAFGISYFMRAGYTTYSDFTHFMLPLLVQGVAMSVFFMAMLTISLEGVAPERVPSATGISNFARITGAQLRGLHLHHGLGPAGVAAPEPPFRRLLALLASVRPGHTKPSGRAGRSPGGRRGGAADGRPGLSALVDRAVLDLRMAFLRHDRPGVAGQPPGGP